ncbi:fructosamine kinase family protein [Arcobacter sp. YIC-464]|uniref:fructosamine kinase family protein n=1 Tax=Arcobacter sp. YIC-464 TaxID=3376631 RepID=UPI003C280B30
METFIKHNNTDFNDALLKEVEGLKLLDKVLKKQNNKFINIPKIINYDENHIELQKIENLISNDELSINLACGLALLHKNENEQFGFDTDNYIGLNKQINSYSNNWGEFFFEYRLMYQINLIKDNDIKSVFLNRLEKHKDKLLMLLNTCKKASLVHGDLWSGNVLYSKDSVYLIDPAVYYADREVDIAMTRIFGGFDDKFYEYYNKTYPLSKEYLKKEPIYNLYHYLNHYNLFGSSYLSSCENIISFIENLDE